MYKLQDGNIYTYKKDTWKEESFRFPGSAVTCLSPRFTQAAPPGLENGFHWRKVTQITLMFSLTTTCSLVAEVELSPSYPTMTYHPWKTSHMNAHSHLPSPLHTNTRFPCWFEWLFIFRDASTAKGKGKNAAASLPRAYFPCLS